MKAQRKTTVVHIKSALPVFGAAAVVLIGALLFPIYRFGWFAAVAVLAAGAYFFLDKIVFTGRDEEIVEELYTGDKELDEKIKYSREVLERFRQAAVQAGDDEIAGQINRIADSAEGIIDEVIQDKGDRGDANTFFSYYMPTLDKLLSYYTQFAVSGKGENAASSKRRIEGCLGMVADSFDKFLDKLYRNEAVEIKASVDVLKTMLRMDGLSGKTDAPSATPTADIDAITSRLQKEAEMEQKQVAQATQG
ncbi:MAG: 5-bromo-4-chloroindolyl phosphate hydrolysis family protein [Clostridia bacterium]|nr:5-bromo-4-chloroindolyl phosphate hydrolysis family protein [Clostridia bacterium]